MKTVSPAPGAASTPAITVETLEALARPAVEKQALLRFGVIGYGYWGPQLTRNLDRLPIGEVAYIADLSPDRREVAHFEFPSAHVTSDIDEVLHSAVDAIVIATPIRTHYDLARRALDSGKHVFVEKPLTAESAQAIKLMHQAERMERVLMVGHTFMYNPAVEELRRLMQSGALGRLYYIDAVRVNLGLFQRDINVMWDLAPHDLSILSYILGKHPQRVSAHGGAYVRGQIHDVVYLSLEYPDGLLAHLHMSWLNPSKVRRFTLVGDQQMAVYDDVEATEKIRIFNRGVDSPNHTSTFGEFQLSYRYGDIVSPHIHWSEPLAVECRHFAECIMEGAAPRSDAREGLRVVQILEAADASLAADGAFVPIAYSDELQQL
ncbi:MAG TPA: Gfo/Idh/MocA family oxidoreductase [Ktedonobacterales bacterium]|jgi:predicted dehydrogenase